MTKSEETRILNSFPKAGNGDAPADGITPRSTSDGQAGGGGVNAEKKSREEIVFECGSITP
jgi:hypothetical protein